MPTTDIAPIKEKIINYLKSKGPSIPVPISREINQSLLFTSAFLSELISERKLKITHMKVGSSPVYYLEGQEEGLEKYAEYLGSKEKEAFSLLKEKRMLNDEIQEPAIRVALRSLKDFAKTFEKDKKIFWRYYLEKEIERPKEEYTETLKKMVQETKNESPKEELNFENSSIQNKKLKEINIQSQKIENIFDKKETETKQNDDKIEEELVDKIKKICEKKKIKIIEETEIKKREFLGIGRIESDIGEMEILIIGKDKKTLNEKDLEKINEEINEQNKIAILFCPGEIHKKAKEVYRKLKNIIFFEKLE